MPPPTSPITAGWSSFENSRPIRRAVMMITVSASNTLNSILCLLL